MQNVKTGGQDWQYRLPIVSLRWPCTPDDLFAFICLISFLHFRYLPEKEKVQRKFPFSPGRNGTGLLFPLPNCSGCDMMAEKI